MECLENHILKYFVTILFILLDVIITINPFLDIQVAQFVAGENYKDGLGYKTQKNGKLIYIIISIFLILFNVYYGGDIHFDYNATHFILFIFDIFLFILIWARFWSNENEINSFRGYTFEINQISKRNNDFINYFNIAPKAEIENFRHKLEDVRQEVILISRYVKQKFPNSIIEISEFSKVARFSLATDRVELDLFFKIKLYKNAQGSKFGIFLNYYKINGGFHYEFIINSDLNYLISQNLIKNNFEMTDFKINYVESKVEYLKNFEVNLKIDADEYCKKFLEKLDEIKIERRKKIFLPELSNVSVNLILERLREQIMDLNNIDYLRDSLSEFRQKKENIFNYWVNNAKNN